MFNFLKKGIKKALRGFKSEEDTPIDQPQEPVKVPVTEPAKEPVKEPVNEPVTESVTNDEKKSIDEAVNELLDSKTGFSNETEKKVKHRKLNEKDFDKLFEEFEISLLESNVAFEVIDKIREKLKDDLSSKKGRLSKIFEDSLKSTINSILDLPKLDIIAEAKKKKPYVILLLGVNGTGKTTTLAKLAKYFIDNGLSVVVSASDTFRAASIEQLEHHCNALGVKLIKHNYNSDPSAVAFDAIQHAKSKNIDVVLIDSAGRLHTNANLMRELEKLKRVSKADLTILVVDALTGNDAVEQAIKFSELGLSGVIVAKSDVDEKGGIILSLAEILKKPILFLGTGQNYEDLVPFDKDSYVSQLFDER